MSLVNDMLKDLEQREQHTARQSVGLSTDHDQASRTTGKAGKLALTVGLLLVVGAIYIVVDNELRQPDPEIARNEINAETAGARVTQLPEEQVAENLQSVKQLTSGPTKTELDSIPDIQPETQSESVVAENAPAPEQSAEQQITAEITSNFTATPEIFSNTSEPAPESGLATEESIPAKPVSILPSPELLDQHAAQEAEALLAQGNIQAAEQRLTGQLTQQKSSPLSARVLAEVYWRQSKTDALANLLQSGQLAGHWVRYYQARTELANNNSKLAESLLRQSLPALSDAMEYHSLLAAVLHKNGNDQLAEAVYNKLVRVESGNHLHWLGLAIAQDAQGLSANALRSFKHALSLQPQQQEVVQYIEQRIEELSRS